MWVRAAPFFDLFVPSKMNQDFQCRLDAAAPESEFFSNFFGEFFDFFRFQRGKFAAPRKFRSPLRPFPEHQAERDFLILSDPSETLRNIYVTSLPISHQIWQNFIYKYNLYSSRNV